MNIIPIQIVVDGDAIIKTHGSGGTLKAPINLGNHTPLVYMFANNDYIVNNNSQGTSGLKITANPNDTVEWRIDAVDRSTYSPLLAQFIGDKDHVMGKARLNIMDLKYYIPSDTDQPDSGVMKEEAKDVVMRAFVAGTWTGEAETVIYTWVFKLLNRVGQVKGYYSWDPRIVVSS